MTTIVIDQIIYNRFFELHTAHDVTVTILDRQYNLHRQVLNTSPYFAKLFTRESNIQIPEFHIDITDTRITSQAVATALEYLYLPTKEISGSKDEMISLMAVSHLFGIEQLKNTCKSFLNVPINLASIAECFSISISYDWDIMLKKCLDYLQWNFSTKVIPDTSILFQFDFESIRKILSMPYLYITTEIELYHMLKKWILGTLSNTNVNSGNLNCKPNDTMQLDVYFKQHVLDGVETFLECEIGKPYIPLFRLLRLQYCIECPNANKELWNDRIIPRNWIVELQSICYRTMVKNEQLLEIGPDIVFPENEFEILSFRCGRRVNNRSQLSWKCEIFNQGIQMHFYVTRKSILVKRNDTRAERRSRLFNRDPFRRIFFKISIASLDANDNVSIWYNGNIKGTLLQHETKGKRLLKLNSKTSSLPYLLSINILHALPVHKNYFLDLYQEYGKCNTENHDECIDDENEKIAGENENIAEEN